MRVCVLGGAGFLGSWITRALLDRGHDVLVMDDLSGGSRGNLPSHSHLLFEQLDLRYDLDNLLVAFETFRPEVIFHLAANAREGASFFQPMSVTSRNIGAYTNVLMASIKVGVRRVICFSSIAIYGDQEPPFVETMPKEPIDVYGLAKAHMEDMTQMLAACHDFEWVIVRPHNVFGPGQRLNDRFRNVFGIWMNQILRGEPLTIFGDGSQVRAFSYIEDCLPAFLACMDCPPGLIFNVGSDVDITVNTACELTRLAMGVPNFPKQYLDDRHAEVRLAYSDHSLAKSILGLKEEIGVEEGVRRMAEWAKSKGPQEWITGDALEIPNELTPKHWR